MAKIIIAGGTGWLGSAIIRYYLNAAHELVVLTRTVRPARDGVRYVRWDGCSLGDWYKELDGADTVINLSGESINRRLTTANKDRIWRSRIDTTMVIGEAIQQVLVPPKVWINASGISIYESSDVVRNEGDEPQGEDFLARVTQQWEQALRARHTPNTRNVWLRISAVLFATGGMLKPLVRLVRMGLGGRIGNGNQYVSWIHETDFVRVVDWIINHHDIYGVIHACSPNPVPNRELMKALRHALKMPLGLPNYTWATKIGGLLIGVDADLILSGRRIVSHKLPAGGFVFDYPEINAAIRNLVVKSEAHK